MSHFACLLMHSKCSDLCISMFLNLRSVGTRWFSTAAKGNSSSEGQLWASQKPWKRTEGWKTFPGLVCHFCPVYLPVLFSMGNWYVLLWRSGYGIDDISQLAFITLTGNMKCLQGQQFTWPRCFLLCGAFPWFWKLTKGEPWVQHP